MPLLTRIDSLALPDHSNLTPEDECYFLGEYYPGKGYTYGDTNSLILNIKKSPLLKGTGQWRYKGNDIRRAGKEMREAINAKWLQGACIVPIPPSKAKTDPEYDDRVVQIGRLICEGTTADLRELLVRPTSGEAMHQQTGRRDIDKLYEALSVDARLLLPAPARIGILDDVITTGASFRAAHRRLREHFPQATIVGFFIARRVPSNNDAVDHES